MMARTKACWIALCVALVALNAYAGEGRKPWEEPAECRGLPIRFVWADKKAGLRGVCFVSQDRSVWYRWAGVTLKAEQSPERGRLSSRVGTFDPTTVKDVSVRDVQPAISYIRISQSDYAVGFIGGSIFFRWGGVLLHEEDVPQEVLALGRFGNVMDFKSIVEIAIPPNFVDKPSDWRRQEAEPFADDKP